MPATPSDAKGMLKAAVQSSAPTVILEHRWLYDITGEVEEGSNPIPLGKAIVRTEGNDVTIVAASYMVIEAMRAAEILTGVGISVEVVDLRTISPLDKETIINSVTKTGRVVVADTGSISFGISAEILACISEEIGLRMRSKPIRIALPDIPTPTSHALTRKFYPTSVEITQAVMVMFGVDLASVSFPEVSPLHDVPSKDFTGPY
jgi:pyruvate dehydrogenase E1 component beta subunit